MPDDQLVRDMLTDAFTHALLIHRVSKIAYNYIVLPLLPFKYDKHHASCLLPLT
jgi:hypothetical protein